MPTLKISEYIGEDWLQERVSFPVTLPESLNVDQLVVREADRSISPAQFEADEPGGRSGRVHFVVDLFANSKRSWTLEVAESPIESDLFVSEQDGCVEFGTSRIAVRCPFGEIDFGNGISAKQAPAPIQAVRLIDGNWTCQAKLHSPLKVLRIHGKVLVAGPVFVKVRVIYTFEGGRKYTIEMEAIAGQEVITAVENSNLDDQANFARRIHPEGAPEGNFILYDFDKSMQKDGSFWTLSFSERLAADRIAWKPNHQMWSSRPRPGVPRMGTVGFIVNGRADGDAPEPGEPRYTFKPPDHPCHLITLNPTHGEWWLNVSNWAGAYSSKNDKNFLALMALQSGRWRRPHENVIVIENDEQGQPRAVLPINTGQRVWGLYSGMRDEAVHYPQDWPNVRMWSDEVVEGERYPQLEYARQPHLAQIKYGYLPLDMVKDWVLEWDDPADMKFPHIFADADNLDAIRKRIAESPFLNDHVTRLKKNWDEYMSSGDPNYPHFQGHFTGQWDNPRGLDNIYLATGEEVYAEALAELLIDELHHFTHRAKAHIGISPEPIEPFLMREADIVLGAAGTTDQQKREIRALLAFSAELFTSRDHAPEGLGYNVHGNIDMRSVKCASLGSIGCLFKSHPNSRKWVQWNIEDIEQLLVDNQVMPNWQMDEWYSSYNMEIATCAGMQLKRAGFADFISDKRLLRSLDFFGRLLTPPDPRYENAGAVAPFGNGQGAWNRTGSWAIVASEIANDNPELASRLMWYWKRSGCLGTMRVHGDSDKGGWYSLGWINPSIEVRNPSLSTEHIDEWGVVLRNGYGSDRETFMAVQLGRRDGIYHYNAEGGFHMYAKGKPLSLLAGLRWHDAFVNSFPNCVCQRFMANRPSFDHANEISDNYKDGISSEHTGKLQKLVVTRSADLICGEWIFTRLVSIPNPGPLEGPNRLVLSKPRPQIPGLLYGQEVEKKVDPITWRRHVMLIKDADPTGPNYFVIRDTAKTNVCWDWSIWCLADDLEIRGQSGYFTGRYDVDMDVVPLTGGGELVTGEWGPIDGFAGYWRQKLYQVQFPTGGEFSAVVFPRLRFPRGTDQFKPSHRGLQEPGVVAQPSPKITPFANGAGAKVELPDRTHYILLADKPVQVGIDNVSIQGRAAVVKLSEAVAELSLLDATHITAGDVELSSGDGEVVTVTIDRRVAVVCGESSGCGGKITLKLPQGLEMKKLLIDNKPAVMNKVKAGKKVEFILPQGYHSFSMK